MKDWKGGIIVAVVFGILGILCLMYYGVIVIYSRRGNFVLGDLDHTGTGIFCPRLR